MRVLPARYLQSKGFMILEPKYIPPVLRHLLTLIGEAADAANTSRLELLLDWVSKQINARSITTEMRLYARDFLFETAERISGKRGDQNGTYEGMAVRIRSVANEMTFRSIEPYAAAWDALSAAMARDNADEVNSACKLLTDLLSEHGEREEVFAYVAEKLSSRAQQLVRGPGAESMRQWAGEWTDRAVA